MKKVKLIFAVIALMAIVSSAVHKTKGTCDIYCSSTCANSDPLNITLDDINGTTTNPCGTGKYYVKIHNVCTEFSTGTHKFSLCDL